MNTNYIIQQLINGLSLGSVYALVAVGYSMVYGILRLINFAHGDIMMLGVYCAFFILTIFHLPLIAALIISMIFSALIGVFVERIAYKPLRSKAEEATLITSLAVSIFIQNLAVMTITAQPRAFILPQGFTKIHSFAGISFSNMNLIIFLTTAIVLIVLTYFIKYSKLGTAMRACSDNLNASRLMGINVNTVVSTTFVIGSALATTAGIMLAGQYGRIDPLMGFVPGLKAFVAAVIGGIGSLSGAVMGGFILGLSEILLVGFLPPVFSPYRDAFVFIILILVLLVKPNGIMGSSDGGRS